MELQLRAYEHELLKIVVAEDAAMAVYMRQQYG
jgi:hypothetical protein